MATHVDVAVVAAVAPEGCRPYHHPPLEEEETPRQSSQEGKRQQTPNLLPLPLRRQTQLPDCQLRMETMVAKTTTIAREESPLPAAMQ